MESTLWVVESEYMPPLQTLQVGQVVAFAPQICAARVGHVGASRVRASPVLPVTAFLLALSVLPRRPHGLTAFLIGARRCVPQDARRAIMGERAGWRGSGVGADYRRSGTRLRSSSRERLLPEPKGLTEPS
jgi:hypothetical protein